MRNTSSIQFYLLWNDEDICNCEQRKDEKERKKAIILSIFNKERF